MRKEKYNSKWVGIGIDRLKQRSIYESLRPRANTILKNRHKEEYKKILKGLLAKEFNLRYSNYLLEQGVFLFDIQKPKGRLKRE